MVLSGGLAAVLYVAAPIVVGLGLGIWLKRWRVVVVLVLLGLAVSIIGWRADWFGDTASGGDFTAGGGALVFWLIICAPLAIGAALGVWMMRRVRRAGDDSSTLPVVPPPSSSGLTLPDRRHR